MTNIKFIGLGINDNNQANVKIYDAKGNQIYNGKTYNGKIKINLKARNAYKLIAYTSSEKIIRYFYISKNKCYIFAFERGLLKVSPITFILTDYHYNLPIERGELILWQR